MNKTLIAIAAAALAAALAPVAQAGFSVPSLNGKPLVQKVECDGEDYAEYLEERAEERAEALEDGEGYAPRRSSVRQSRAQTQRASAQSRPAATKSPTSTADAGEKKDDTLEPKKADAPESKKADSKSIASADSKACKQFFPSVGMTLSVPCE